MRKKLAASVTAAAALTLMGTEPAAGARWYPWESLGGTILDRPACVSWGAGRIDCFARGTNNGLYHRGWSSSGWTAWRFLGGYVLSPPECVSWGPGRIDCFAIGGDAAVWHVWGNGSTWSSWESLGGQVDRATEAPSCTSWATGRLDCFVRGTAEVVGGRYVYRMHHRWFASGRWNPSSWENLGGDLASTPECLSLRGSNQIDCFVVGDGGRMHQRRFNGSGWEPWRDLGGRLSSEPECVSWGLDHTDCYVQGDGGEVWHRWRNGSSWAAWESLHGSIFGFGNGPSCVTWGVGRIDCFVQGTDADRRMWHKWWDDGRWSPAGTGWEDLGGKLRSEPECVSWGPGRIDCFARGIDGRLYHTWYG